jgi:hypothetical protein
LIVPKWDSHTQRIAIFLEFYKCYILTVAIDLIYHLQKLDWKYLAWLSSIKVFSAIFSRDASCSNYFTPKCLTRLVNDFKHILCSKKAYKWEGRSLDPWICKKFAFELHNDRDQVITLFRHYSTEYFSHSIRMWGIFRIPKIPLFKNLLYKFWRFTYLRWDSFEFFSQYYCRSCTFIQSHQVKAICTHTHTHTLLILFRSYQCDPKFKLYTFQIVKPRSN